MPPAKLGSELLRVVPESGAETIASTAGPMSTHAVSVSLLFANVKEYFGCTIRSTSSLDAFVRLFDDAVFQSAYSADVSKVLHNEGAWA